MSEKKIVFDIKALLEKSQNLTDDEKRQVAKAVKNSLLESEEIIKRFHDDMKYDWKILYEPFTI